MMKQTLIDERYVIVDLLGSGGMARVFLAHDELLDRDVAFKVLRDQYVENEEFIERFRREAKSVAILSHPNIVSVYDWGSTEDGTYYIAMEYVSGGTLKDRIAGEGALDPAAVAELSLQAAEALGFAHERGVIHRDVKSQNILLTADGEVKVADFGVARAMAETGISQSGLILGTASYMSPEQAMGEPVGPASDLYSLGIVLYEMLTGEVPFKAETLIGVCMKHVNELPRPPREINPEVSKEMSSLVMRLLEKRPEDRYGSVAELAEDLQRVRVGLPPLAMVPVEGDPEATQGIDAWATVPLPSDLLVRKAMRRKRVRARASSILVAVFALFALLGSASWNLLQDSWGRDPASNLEASQEQGSVPNPQDSQDPASSSQETTSEVTEQPKQASSSETPSTKSPAKAEAPANIVPTDTSAGQAPPAEAAAKPSTPASTGIAPIPQQASAQPAPQQASVQPTSQRAPQQEAAQPASTEPTSQQDSAQQAQVKLVSSYTSSGGANGNRNSDGIQMKQHGGKASQNSKSSRKD